MIGFTIQIAYELVTGQTVGNAIIEKLNILNESNQAANVVNA
jgi:hypothetical protein